MTTTRTRKRKVTTTMNELPKPLPRQIKTVQSHALDLTLIKDTDMRKIERQMLQAIVDDRSYWGKDNTRVEWDDSNKCYDVYLHGHCIAMYTPSDSSLKINNCGYETNTTKSRLNAIIDFVFGGVGNGIFQKNWNWYMVRDGQQSEFPSNEWVAL